MKTKDKTVLHLVLKKKWFDMIFSGEKREEYRDVTEYWNKRLKWPSGFYKPYTIVCFTNGYAKDARRFTMEIDSINIYKGGWPHWGAKINKKYYVIKLGSLLQTYNF